MKNKDTLKTATKESLNLLQPELAKHLKCELDKEMMPGRVSVDRATVRLDIISMMCPPQIVLICSWGFARLRKAYHNDAMVSALQF